MIQTTQFLSHAINFQVPFAMPQRGPNFLGLSICRSTSLPSSSLVSRAVLFFVRLLRFPTSRCCLTASAERNSVPPLSNRLVFSRGIKVAVIYERRLISSSATHAACEWGNNRTKILRNEQQMNVSRLASTLSRLGKPCVQNDIWTRFSVWFSTAFSSADLLTISWFSNRGSKWTSIFVLAQW